MRIKPGEIESIKSAIQRNLDSVEIFLFGSRVDDKALGGDIDILILGHDEVDGRVLAKIRIELEKELGEQKIDIVYQQKEAMTPFGKLAKMDGVLL